MRPGQRLAVDVLLQQPLAHHQRQRALGPPPGRIGRLVDDVPQVVEASGIAGLAGSQPGFARLAALPGPGGEAQNLDLDAAALERARQDVGAAGRHHDRPAAHAARVVEQQRHDGVAEVGVALVLEGERVHRIGDDAGQPRRVERALLEVEVPGAVLLRHQLALQPVGEPRHRALQVAQLLVEEGAQPLQLVGRGQVLGADLLVVVAAEDLVAEGLRVIEHVEVGPPRLARVGHLLAVGIGVELVGIGVLGGLGGLALLALAALVLAGLVLAVLAFRVVLGVLLAAFGVLLVVLAFLALALGQLLGKIERLEQIAQLPAERLLVLRQLVHAWTACALRAPRSTARHRSTIALAVSGGAGAGQPLAHDEREGVLERRVGPLGDLGIAPVAVLVLDAGGEIGGHAGHAIGAQRLDAGPLDRLEHGAGRARLGRQPRDAA